jgi:hypothetical protein
MRRLYSALTALMVLAACNDQSGAEYLGKWEAVHHNRYPCLVERNGDAFIVRILGQGMDGTQSVPATLKDGALLIQSEMGTMSIVIDKKSGHLLIGGDEFQKAAK